MSVVAVLKNKHLVVALLVTPLLAVLAWYAVGWFAAGDVLEPEVAQPGQAYPLIEGPGCRYAEGRCRLSNEDFELAVAVTADAEVTVSSALPLESLLMGLRSDDRGEPMLAQRLDAQGLRWRYQSDEALNADDALRAVAVSAGTAYFGEASLRFIEAGEALPGDASDR